MTQQMAKMDTMVQQMQEMRNKIMMEKDPAVRQKLMLEHMQTMQNGMNMMNMMDKGMMSGQHMMGSQGMMGNQLV